MRYRNLSGLFYSFRCNIKTPFALLLTMKLSVVIVNYNVRFFLQQCLESLQRSLADIDSEIFIVDNHSSDSSRSYLQSLKSDSSPLIHVVFNEDNPGFSKANNQAIAQAQGEYILLLNPDTIVPEPSLKEALDFMDMHVECGALGVKMIDGKGVFLRESKRGMPTPWASFCKMFGLSAVFPKSSLFSRYHLGFLPENEINEVDILSGAFMLMRRKALDKSGLLDERFFMYGEDIDLSYRIQQSGFVNYYFPKANILHYKGESTKKDNMNYIRVFYRAMVQFAAKHYHGHFIWLYSAAVNVGVYLRAAISTICMKWKNTRKSEAEEDRQNRVSGSWYVVASESERPGLVPLLEKWGFSVANVRFAQSCADLKEASNVIFSSDSLSYDEILSAMVRLSSPQASFKIVHVKEGYMIGSGSTDC